MQIKPNEIWTNGLDNTLLEKILTIAKETLELLKKCASKGIHIVIATGRLFYSAEKYAKEIGPNTKILCYNGCLVTEADGTALFKAELTPNIMKEVASFAKEHGLYSQFYLDHKILVEEVLDLVKKNKRLPNVNISLALYA